MLLQTLAVSDADVCKSFLQRGYLPEVFPPILTSKAWSENIDLQKLVIDAPKGMELNKISYSCTKRGYGRRYFDLVHPASAVATSAWMSRHWKDIQAFCNKTDTAPIEILLLDDDENRSIVSCSFDKVLQEAKQDLPALDILSERTSPNITLPFTPMSFLGRSTAKRPLKKITVRFRRSCLGTSLIGRFELGQGNQTKGIPVGPDFSRAVGELIGVGAGPICVGKNWKQIRWLCSHIDDFYIGASDLASAEAILHALQESLRAYELELNDDKTSIKEARTLIDESWIHELDIVLGSSPKDPSKAIERAFDRAFHLANTTFSDSSLKYLVRTADRLTSSEEVALKTLNIASSAQWLTTLIAWITAYCCF